MAKGFKHGAGGGAGLNFKVVGNPKPENPKENTIWVDTDTKITSWDFAATQPRRRSGNKNLNVYPYVGPDANAAANGITFTDNGDGSVTVNGTASADTLYRCSNSHASKFDLAPGVYTLSDVNGTTSCRTEIMLSYDNGASWAAAADCNNGTKTFTVEKPALARINIKIFSGKTANNVRLYPQLEKGSAATDFVKGDATGQVWIATGTFSGAAFNALKKNGIQVYPISTKQYIGGAWVVKEAKISSQNGWNEFSRYLYKPGDECADLTGGWGAYALKYNSNISSSGKAPTITKTDDGSLKMTYEKNSGGGGVVRTVNKIDLSDFTALEFTGYMYNPGSNNYISLYIWSAMGSYITQNMVAEIDANNVKTVTTFPQLDISGLTGEYYIGFSFYTNADGAEALMKEMKLKK